jgi:uncharacterized protein YigE (DUF2233 family)
MINKKTIFTIILFAAVAMNLFAQKVNTYNSEFVSYTVNPRKQDLKLYWKDNKQEKFRNILKLKTWLGKKHKTLVFAMNAGMYKEDNSPLGLFIDNGKIITTLNTATRKGNFYMNPNGVFYVTTNKQPVICATKDFKYNAKIKYATQSGPMLLINGKINTAFKQGSSNLNIRNGVGILSDNRVVFVMSKTAINFYDFADYFKSIGCINALYLDGFVSRTYLPEQNWMQLDGDFGVMIGVTVNTGN